MDLTRSSTAQKEDHGVIARVAHNLEPVSGRHVDRSTHCIEREGVQTAGCHLIVDLYGASKLDDLKHIEHTLKRCVQVADATLLHIHLQRFTPNGGVSGVVVMAGSHISIYSWPETGYAALDLFIPADDKATLCVDVLKQAFAASKVIVKTNVRGKQAELRQQRAPASVPSPSVTAAVESRSLRTRIRVRKAA